MDRVRELRNPIRNYAWGSRTALAELLGARAVPASEPQAELWMGAHPSDPSRVVTVDGDVPLDEWIRRDPAAVLGADAAARFGSALPFLFKVLAVERPLSVQAHPSKAQAQAGFARENSAGMPIDAPQRNYRDANHKPELICALTRFRALNRFRQPEDVRKALEDLRVGDLALTISALHDGGEGEGLPAALRHLMTLEGEALERTLSAAVEQSELRGADDHAWRWVGRLAREHPGDVGALAPLLLNLVELEPGEAMFLPSGQLHAYLEGVGVELMANSDNVLRGGLTDKHVDVNELLSTLEFDAGDVQVLRPERVSPHELRYATRIDEFELSQLDVGEGRHDIVGPRSSVEILLCTEGSGRVCAAGQTQPFTRGTVLLIPASVPAYAVEGGARRTALYKAGVGRARPG